MFQLVIFSCALILSTSAQNLNSQQVQSMFTSFFSSIVSSPSSSSSSTGSKNNGNSALADSQVIASIVNGTSQLPTQFRDLFTCTGLTKSLTCLASSSILCLPGAKCTCPASSKTVTSGSTSSSGVPIPSGITTTTVLVDKCFPDDQITNPACGNAETMKERKEELVKLIDSTCAKLPLLNVGNRTEARNRAANDGDCVSTSGGMGVAVVAVMSLLV